MSITKEDIDALYKQANAPRFNLVNWFMGWKVFNLVGFGVVAIITLLVVAYMQGWMKPFRAIFDGTTILDTIDTQKTREEYILARQMFRYCTPDWRHRFGNGYDEVTCMQKWEALGEKIYERKHGLQAAELSPELEAEIERNRAQYMEEQQAKRESAQGEPEKMMEATN